MIQGFALDPDTPAQAGGIPPGELVPEALGSGVSHWQLQVVVPHVGSSQTKLIAVRGDSGSGKSAIAAELRERYGRGIAIVGQDNLRRVVRRERDRSGAANIGLIGLTARYALDHRFHVIQEGILTADRYSEILLGLCQDHVGGSHLYYIDLPLAETLRRHTAKPNAHEFGEAEMTAWYRPQDLLHGGVENIIGQDRRLH